MISLLPASWALFCASTTTLRARGVNRPKPALGSSARVGLGHEPLLRGLLGDAHALADLGPRRPRPAGLVDEVADEVVGDLAEGLGGQHGVGELIQRFGVHLLDDADEVVEADGVGDLGWLGHVVNFRLTTLIRQPAVDDCVSAARIPAAHGAVENAQGRAQRELGDDREDVGVAPVLVDVGPVVERRDQRAAVGRFEPIAVDVPDVRLDLAEDRSRR